MMPINLKVLKKKAQFRNTNKNTKKQWFTR